jgi:hypothetical protein
VAESAFEEVNSADLKGVGSVKGGIGVGSEQVEEVGSFLDDLLRE